MVTAQPMLTAQNPIKTNNTVRVQPTIQVHTPYKAPVQQPQDPTDWLAKYNDPYQINTVWDIMFNTAGLKQNYGGAGIKERAQAVVDVVNNQYLQPIKHGRWGIAGRNTLYALGETVDVFGNIVKGAVAPLIDRTADIDYDTALQAVANVQDGYAREQTDASGKKSYTTIIKGVVYQFDDKQLDQFYDVVNSGRTVNVSELTFSERIKASIGVGDYGRINFDANTGSIVGDIVLEVLLDPETWLTLGTASVAKTATKQLSGAVDDLAKNADLLFEFGNSKALAQNAMRIYRNGTTVSARNYSLQSLLSQYLDVTVKQGRVYNAYNVKNIADALQIALIRQGVPVREFSDSMVREAITRGTNKYVNNMTTSVLRVLDSTTDVINKVQEYGLKLALTPTGVYPVYSIAKRSVSNARFIQNKLYDAEKIYANAFGNRPILSFVDSSLTDLKVDKNLKDALPVDLADFYSNPNNIRRIEIQARKDMSVFDSWFKSIQENNIADSCIAVRNYIAKAQAVQGQTITVEALHKQLAEYLSEGVLDSPVIKQYYDKLTDVVKQLEYLETYIDETNAYNALSTIHSGLIVSSQDTHATENVLQGYINNFSDALFDVDELEVFTMAHVEQNLFKLQTEVYGSVADAVEFVKGYSVYGDTLCDMYLNNVAAALSEHTEEVLQAYSKVVGEATFSTKLHYKKFVDALTSEKHKQLLVDRFTDLSDKWYKGMLNNMVTNGQISPKVVDAPNLIKLNVIEAHQQYNENFKKAHEALLKLSENKGYGKKLTEDIDGYTYLVREQSPIAESLYATIDMLEQQDIKLLVKPSDRLDGLRDAAAYNYDTLRSLVSELYISPIESKAYTEAYNTLCGVLENAATQSVYTKHADVQSVQETVQAVLDMLQEHCTPKNLDFFSEKVTVFEDVESIKQEMFTSLINVLEDKDVNALIQSIDNTDVHSLLVNASNNFNNLFSEELQFQAQKILNMSVAYNHTNNMLQEVLSAGLTPDTMAAFLSESMKYFRLTGAEMAKYPNYFIDTILDKMQNFPRYSKQYARKQSLDAVLTDNQFKPYIEAVFNKAGIPLPAQEEHVVLSDLMINYGVAQALAEQDEVLKATLDNNLVIMLDMEARNTKVQADANSIHQVGFIAYYKGTEVGRYAVSVKPEVITGTSGFDYLPDHDYLYSLVKNKLGEDAPALTSAELRDFYIKHITSGNTDAAAASGDAVLLQNIKRMYGLADTYGTWDTKQNCYTGVTIIGHNIEGFDLPLIKSTFSAHGLYEKAATFESYGINLRLFNKLPVVDTYKKIQKYDNMYCVSPEEATKLRHIMLRYLEGMQEVPENRMFTAVTPGDLYRIKHFCSNLSEIPNAPKEYSELSARLGNYVNSAMASVAEVKENNKILRGNYLPASLITDPDNRVYWEKFMRNELGLSEEEIVKRFGDNLDNLQWSSFFGAMGDLPTYAYKHLVKTSDIEHFFGGVAEAVASNEVTRAQLYEMHRISQTLKYHADKVTQNSVFAEYIPEFRRFVDSAMQLSQFSHLKYLRTEGLNVNEQYAVAKLLFNKIFDEEEMRKVFLKAYGFADPDKYPRRVNTVISLLQNPPKRKDISIDPYYYVLQENSIKTKLRYQQQLEKTVNLQQEFEQYSTWTDRQGLLGSAATLRIRAAEPMLNTMQEFIRNCPDDIDDAFKDFSLKELDLYERMCKAQTDTFINLNAEDTLRWIVSTSGRPVLIDVYGIAQGGNYSAYTNFISKLDSAEFKALGIEWAEEDGVVWVALNKKADFKMHYSLDNASAQYYVNGKAIEPFEHRLTDSSWFKPVYSEYTDIGMLQKAIDSLDYTTAGTARGSVYELFGQDAFLNVYSTMPQKLREVCVDAEQLCAPHMWDAVNFNKNILGSRANRVAHGIGTSGRPLGTLNNVTQYSMEHSSAKLVYTQAMLGQNSAIRNTHMGRLLEQDPAGVAQWFKQNPDYTAVALVQDSKHIQGYKVMVCDMTTAKGVKQAYDFDAKIVSYSEANKLYEVINSNMFSETHARGWQSIVRMYKIGYLANPGTWARNAMDSFLKNVQSTGADTKTMLREYGVAYKELSVYDDIAKALNAQGHGHRPPEGLVKKFFEGRTDMDYTTFKSLDAFFSDPAAGSESRVYTKLNSKSRKAWLEQLNNAEAITTDEYRKQLNRGTFNNITNALLSPMNEVERVARLAAYNTLTKQGHTTNTALRIVENTHFAYSVKSELEQTMELFVPFYTFASRNLNYWLDAISVNPAYFSILRDVLAPCLDLNDYSDNEYAENASLQRSILSGNIPSQLLDDYYWSTGFSFMDALKWLTNPVAQADGAIFSPVQAVVDAFLQDASDDSYTSGKTALSNWMQETFGLKMTEQQVIDKYGEWAEEYKKQYGFMISKQDPLKTLCEARNVYQLIPLIGSQIQRLETTGVYFDDGDGIKALVYLAGFAGKPSRWDNPKLSTKYNKALFQLLSSDENTQKAFYNLKRALGYENLSLSELPFAVKQQMLEYLQDPSKVFMFASDTFAATGTKIYNLLQQGDDAVTAYTQFKRVLGYGEVSLSDLPETTKQTIYTLMLGNAPAITVAPIIQDGDKMSYLWNALKRKYNVQHTAFEDMPDETVQSMYSEIAESVVHLANVYDMLENDESSRYSYAVAKSKLGLKALKPYQLPIDALKVIEAAMQNKAYGQGATKQYTQRAYTPKRKTTSKKQFGYTQKPYDAKKAVYKNYGHNDAASEAHKYQGFYKDHYTAIGNSRMELAMQKITPQNMKYKIDAQFYYYL